MYEIRISNIDDSLILGLLSSIGGSAIAVIEGGDFDEGIKRHHHIFLLSQKMKPQTDMKSDSFIRKAIQQLDKTRKGNDLYSMKQSHENSPNYVLKKVFSEEHNWLDNPRLLHIHPYHKEHLTDYKGLHDAYLLTIAKKAKHRKLAKTNSSYAMCLEIADTLIAKNEGSYQNDIIELVINYHEEKQILLPSRSNMERYIITITNLIGKTSSYKHLVAYYSLVNFPF